MSIIPNRLKISITNKDIYIAKNHQYINPITAALQRKLRKLGINCYLTDMSFSNVKNNYILLAKYAYVDVDKNCEFYDCARAYIGDVKFLLSRNNAYVKTSLLLKKIQ